VSRGAEDLKDNLADAGNKLKGDSKGAGDDLSKKADRTGKDLQNKAEDAADDSEGMLKKVGWVWVVVVVGGLCLGWQGEGSVCLCLFARPCDMHA
jgi:hypothetical protein